MEIEDYRETNWLPSPHAVWGMVSGRFNTETIRLIGLELEL